MDAFAVQNAYESNYELDGQTVVLINVGAAVSNINILSGGVDDLHPRHHDGRQRLHRGDPEAAQHLLRRGGGLKVGGQGESDAVVPQEVERVIQGVAEQMGGEINSLDFFASTSGDARIGRVYLSGGTARIAALQKVLEARAGVRVEAQNPFKNVDVDNRRFDPAEILAAAPSAAVGVGLALRSAGDK